VNCDHSASNGKARFYALTSKGRKELVKKESEWRRNAGAIMRVMGPQQ
jgi:DNA-binding PadR family transcriptional regulator